MQLKQCLRFNRILCGIFLFGAISANALQLNWSSSTNFYVDFSSDMRSDYVAVTVTNSDGVAYSNLWVTIDSFTNGVLQLGSGETGQYVLGALANGQSKPAFFYLQSTNDPANSGIGYPSRFAIKVFKGYPGLGTLLVSNNFSVNEVTSGQNNANKVTSLFYSPTNNPVVGGIFKITVQGTTGNVKEGNDMAFTAATFTNWNAGAFQLVASSVIVTDSPNYFLTNNLDTTATSHITGNGDMYQAEYWFRAIATTKSNTPVSPVNFLNNGGGTVNHVQETVLQALPPVLPAINLTTLNAPTNFVQLYTNEVVIFTLRVTNASVFDVTLDRFVDLLPRGLVYVAGSSTFGGVAILDPTNANQVLTWSQIYSVPAGTSRDFAFRAYPTNTTSSYFTNSCVGYVENSQIDTTLDTSDNAPATEIVRALIAPVAQNVNTNVLENRTLNVPAAGVLANTVEPNSFAATIISYTQPAHGSVTVSNNGGYIYIPSAFYWGADAFTFTMTNQNGRISTATNSITVNWVNQPPYFTKGTNVTALENSSAQTISSWATGISRGTNDPAQTLTFRVSNNNSNLFSAQPQISSSGVLTFTPATFAFGTATVSVYLQDNGGTANGGNDTSATQTFTITVNWVNQQPYFTKGTNVTVLDNGGAQTIANWATGINSGTNDPVQTLTFHVSNNSSNLFSVQPQISPGGTLTFTPAANQFGSATVSVYLTDDGGTANGGNNTGVTQTFTINVNFVNQPPTLNALTNLTLTENWNQQTVNLSGITAGPTNESSQNLTVTTTSSNPSVIPNPTVNYTSPASTGSLTFTPATNFFGASTITVIVHDDGGTANGGIDSVTNTFTVLVQGLTNYWFGGSNLPVNINDALNPGGISQTNYLGVLDVPATSANPFTIKLGGAGTNFNSASNYVWTIATVTRGPITGFATNKIVVDTSSFTNDLAGGYFKVVLSGDSNSVDLVYVGNNPPTAGPATYPHNFNTYLRIPIQNLLTNYTSDPDGDANVLVSVGTSTNGSNISANNLYILVAPPNNVTESFTYVIRDGRSYRPGDTVYYATNWITIQAIPTVGYANHISVGNGGSVSVKFLGIPNYAYDIERADNPTGPWTVIWTTNAPPNGAWIFVDSNPPQPSAFYRTKQH